MQYSDIADNPEDERIRIICEKLADLAPGQVVGVCTDDEPGKPERYAEKIMAKFPSVKLLDQTKGPVANVVMLRFIRQAAA